MVDFYASVQGFRTYHLERGGAVPDGASDDAAVARWLLVASEWVDGRFRGSFPGTKVGMRAQVREWPRNSAYDKYNYLIPSNVLPAELLAAVYEVALREGNAPGSLTVDYTPSQYKRVSVDGAISVEYASFNSAADAQTQFTIVAMILDPILTGAGNNSSLSGGSFRV